MTTTKTIRRCAGKTCVTPLNSYNSGDFCGACSMRQADEAVAALREQIEKREREERERQALGLLWPDKRPAYTKATLIEELHKMADALGRPPCAKDCGGEWPSVTAFANHFGGSFAAAREAAGLARPTSRALVLEHLADGMGDGKKIAESMGVDKTRVFQVLRKLVAEGLVTSRNGKRVGRHGSPPVFYSLTKKGKA